MSDTAKVKAERNYKEDYEALKNDLEIFALNLSNDIGKAEKQLDNAIYLENHLHCILLQQKKEILNNIVLKLDILAKCA